MIQFNSCVAELGCMVGSKGLKGAPWDFNLRDLFRWCELMCSSQGLGSWDPAQYLDLIYCQRLRSDRDTARIKALFGAVFGAPPVDRPRYWAVSASHVQVGATLLPRATRPLAGGHTGLEPSLPLPSALGPLEAIAKAIDMQWMALLVGPSGSGKTSMVRLLAQETGHALHEYAMDATVDVAEFLGCFEQRDLSRHRRGMMAHMAVLVAEALEAALLADPTSTGGDDAHEAGSGDGGPPGQLVGTWAALQAMEARGGSALGQSEWFDAASLALVRDVLGRVLSIASSTGSTQLQKRGTQVQGMVEKVAGDEDRTARGFEWVDGMLIRALEEGHWVLVDNVNFCNPSVLDRLNALLEPQGVLAVNECGLKDGELRVVVPHKEFRLFLCMDPRHGEISRAMRNRGVEVWVQGPPVPSVDVITLLQRAGVACPRVAQGMAHLHNAARLVRPPACLCVACE